MRTTALASFVIAVGACGGGGGDEPPPGPEAISEADAERYCRLECEYEVGCGATETVESCIATCVGDSVGVFRGDAFAAFIECEIALDCGVDDAVCNAEVEPLPVHDEYETRCRQAIAACGLTPDQINGTCEATFDPDGAGGVISIYPETTVDEAIACFDNTDCNAIFTCLSAVLGL